MSFTDKLGLLKERLRIADVLKLFGRKTPTGSRTANTQVRCIFADDRDKPRPSLSIYERGQRFKCHRCGRGGDVLDMAVTLEQEDAPSITTGDVLTKLCSLAVDAGLVTEDEVASLPDDEGQSAPERIEAKFRAAIQRSPKDGKPAASASQDRADPAQGDPAPSAARPVDADVAQASPETQQALTLEERQQLQAKYITALEKSSRAQEYVQRRGWSREVLRRFGIGWDARGRAITFPLTDADGDILGWQRRFLEME